MLHTAWWRIAGTGQQIALSTSGSSFDMYRADNGTSVACASGGAPSVAVKVTAGDYLVQVATKGTDFAGLGEGPITTTAQFTVDPDTDQDGVPPPADCNDRDAAIRPGALEIAGDGVDQDCSGADLVIDGDRDGSPALKDCNDENAKINPKAKEIRGNAIDERRVIAVRSLAASRSLPGYVRGARPRRGAVIEIRVTKSRTTGVVRRLAVRGAAKLPRKQDLCLPFAGDPPARC